MTIPASAQALLARYALPGRPDNPLAAVARLIVAGEFSRSRMDEVLSTYKSSGSDQFHDSLLDLVLSVIREGLRDRALSVEEQAFIQQLKGLFGIKEGDLYELRREQIKSILSREMDRMLEDRTIDSVEAIHQVALQRSFDLSYDQYVDLTKDEAIRVVDRLIDMITADGVITAEERSSVSRQILALDTVYTLTAQQRSKLAEARFSESSSASARPHSHNVHRDE